MARKTKPYVLPVALGLAVVLGTLLWWTRNARAQDARVRDLARICAGEAGIQSETGDCAAIIFLLQRRAERQGVTLEQMARAYSGRHLGVEASPRPWIANLDLDGSQPAGWPATASWARYRPAWLELVQHVRDTLDGAVLDPCPGADHWGGAMDDHRAIGAGWDRVECDLPTRNHFWRVPRRSNNGS